MLKFYSTLIGLQEIPDEVSLVINIANCPIHCSDCHAPMLWGNIGTPLTADNLKKLIEPLADKITCVVFMGGDIEPDSVNELADYIRREFLYIKIGWYSGRIQVPLFIEYRNFDYIKLGPYVKSLGGLDSPITNQRLYKVQGCQLFDITEKFWKK